MAAPAFLKGMTNDHIEATRLLGVVSCIMGIVYSGANLVLNHTFSIVEFGIGMGSLIALVAGGSGVKDLAQAQARKTSSEATPTNADNNSA